MKLYPLKGQGGKGGGGAARTPQEDPNTLRSRAYATIIDMISEGPIEGFSTVSGITIKDATLLIQPSIHDVGETKGVFYYPSDTFVPDDYGVVTVKATGLAALPVVSGDSSGYPYSAMDVDLDIKGIKCL